jgi:hypothetical protein
MVAAKEEATVTTCMLNLYRSHSRKNCFNKCIWSILSTAQKRGLKVKIHSRGEGRRGEKEDKRRMLRNWKRRTKKDLSQEKDLARDVEEEILMTKEVLRREETLSTNGIKTSINQISDDLLQVIGCIDNNK